jgi:hypothetical protein
MYVNAKMIPVESGGRGWKRAVEGRGVGKE